MWKDKAPPAQEARVPQMVQFFEMPHIHLWANKRNKLLQACGSTYLDNLQAHPKGG